MSSKKDAPLSFSKYQGTGNDFILIDNREEKFSHLTRAQIAKICDRRFGVGADGLILLNLHPTLDFEMKNYNSDGGECSMCGNGARTLVQFARDLKISGAKKDGKEFRFWAIDGEHEARVEDHLIHLKMRDVNEVQETPAGFVLDTGSPHLVCKAQDLLNFDVVTEGRKLRNSTTFMPAGINVNFVESYGKHLYVRTYERGVEDETLSCGTGIIASALMFHTTSNRAQVQTRGGLLEVQFNRNSSSFSDIWLIGPAVKTFTGSFIIA